MVKILKIRAQIDEFLKKISNRGRISYGKVKENVESILNDIENNGDLACLKYTEKFDGIKLKISEIRVSDSEIQDAYQKVDEKGVKAIKQAIRNIQKFHEAQIKKMDDIETVPGVLVGQLIIPYESIGIYIPGGRAPYLSTVLMTTVPAKISGVNQIIITTPPNKDKKINPAILVAANESGVDTIFKIGGAQAIAAMTFGTKSIPKVNKIIGPGNIYVNTAKILANQNVAIDLPAGPSEILIIADENSNVNFISDDLISQAEHDPNVYTFLVSNSIQTIEKVKNIISENLNEYTRRNIIKEALENNCYLILAKNIEDMFEISNKIAPEHLEIHLKNPNKYLPLIKNAGAIFLGEFSPVPIGDYAAGSNHVLPTGGLAKSYSGLSSYDFVKFVDVVKSTKDGLKNLKDTVISLAKIEGFDAHKKTILGRLEE